MLAISLILCALFLALALHPFITYPLSLLLVRRRDGGERAAASGGVVHRPTVSICVSAYNEERVIVARVETLLATAARYGPATIHVYADCPSDNTVALLRPYADRIDLVVGRTRRGKTAGLNTLIPRTSGEVLVFTDANVVHDDAALEKIVAPFADPTVGLASAQLSYVNRRDSATSAMGALYWSIEEAIKRLESRTVGIIGVDGAMFAIRRRLYRPAPAHLIDDFFVSLNVLIQRARVVNVEGLTVEERSAVGAREEFRRKARIACQSVNVHKVLWHDLRRMPSLSLYAYVSHRLMKWHMPFAILLAALCATVAIAALFGAGIALATVVGIGAFLVLGYLVRFKPAGLAMTAVLSLAGVGLGVLQSIFTTRTYTVWAPADSVRGPEDVSSEMTSGSAINSLPETAGSDSARRL